MKDFSKGFNGVSADMIKTAAEIAKQSARTANEQKQQDAAKMAARYENVRPATSVESGSRPVERMYASMKPTHLNPVGETIASRVAALSEGTSKMKPATSHEKLSHDSYLLEPKVKMAKPLKKIPADEAVLTDEDKAKLAEILASIDEKKLDPVGKEDADVNNDGKTDKTDSYLKKRRAAISSNIKEEETVEEGWDDMVKAAKDTLKDKPKPNGGAGIKKGTRYGGGKQKDGEEKAEKKEEANEEAKSAVSKVMQMAKIAAKKTLRKVGGGTDAQQLQRLKDNMKEGVNRDTPGQEHVCAVHVKHAKLGEGRTLFSQHAEPDAEGNIAWYDVMFAEGIERVETKDLEIVVSESHMNHKKKK